MKFTVKRTDEKSFIQIKPRFKNEVFIHLNDRLDREVCNIAFYAVNSNDDLLKHFEGVMSFDQFTDLLLHKKLNLEGVQFAEYKRHQLTLIINTLKNI